MFEEYNALISGVVKDFPLFGLGITHHQNKRGQPISIKDRPALAEFFADFPNIKGADICKATQTGATETFLQLMLLQAGWQGRIVAYSLSTAGLRNRLVKNRVNPLLTEVPAYRELIPLVDLAKLEAGASSLREKNFGAGELIFLGSNTRADFVEFSADTIIIDEYDLSDMENVALAMDRIREGVDPQIFHLGNPDTPRKGIHGLWLRGDRRRFTFVCGNCGHRQPIDWYQNVVEKDDDGNWTPRDHERAEVENPEEVDLRPVCRQCREPFDRVAKGSAWVAEKPERDRRSYLMSRLDSLTQRIRDAFKEFVDAQASTEKMVAFHRGMLGIPYEVPDARFTDDLLMRLTEDQPAMIHPSQIELTEDGENPFEDEVVTAGIDVGKLFHIQVSVYEHFLKEDGEIDHEREPLKRRIFVGTRDHEDEVLEILEAFAVDTAVIDANPETRIAKYIRDEAIAFGCTVWLCSFFPTERVGDQEFGMVPDWTSQTVKVDRTQTFDSAFHDAKKGRVVWPCDAWSALGWGSQMKEPMREFNEKRGTYIWTKGVDHYHLANVYGTIADTLEQSGGGFFAFDNEAQGSKDLEE